MNLFDKLFEISETSDSLEKFLNENMQLVNDFHNCNFRDIASSKDSIERFILLKANIINQIDYGKNYNKAFISMLLDFCERFNFIAAAPRIYTILKNNDINIGHRLQSALLYLHNIDCNSRLVERFDLICEKLQISINIEEDNEKKALSTFLNYYATVIRDTHVQYAEAIKLKIGTAIEQNSYSFLKSVFIKEALSISLLNAESAYEQLQLIIDRLLSKVGFAQTDFIAEIEELLIETHTEYSNILKHTNKSFKSIRKISFDKIKKLVNKEEIHNSLGRGVAILKDEAQMYSYMNGFGSAHHAKMLSALKMLPFNEMTDNVEIFDWGCGQGLASIVLFDYLNTKSISLNNTNITLIEPSILCIKRAALHVKLFNNNSEIKTVCKDLDSLDRNDVKSNSSNTKIHFFSNILDVDDFSLTKLIELIENTQKGTNYFVCVSPYITDIKTDRVDSFVRYFKRKYKTFISLGEKTNGGRKDDEYWNCNNRYKKCMCPTHPHTCNGKNKWTRVIRVFKLEF